MPSHPSSDISEEESNRTARSPSVYDFVFGKSTWEGLTVTPNEGILEAVEKKE